MSTKKVEQKVIPNENKKDLKVKDVKDVKEIKDIKEIKMKLALKNGFC